MSAPTISEVPIAIPFRGMHLFGIVSEPAMSRDPGVLVLRAQGGTFGGRTRFALRVAHALAAAGYRALRLDYEGSGESDGGVVEPRTDRLLVDEVRAALHALVDLGHDRVLIVGYCYGARVGLSAARGLPEVAGVALLAPPVVAGRRAAASLTTIVHRAAQPARWRALGNANLRSKYARIVRVAIVHRARRLARPRSRRVTALAPDFSEGLADLERHGVPTLLLFGADDPALVHVGRAAELDRFVTGDVPTAEMRVVPGQFHGLRDPVVEERVIDAVTAWADAIP